MPAHARIGLRGFFSLVSCLSLSLLILTPGCSSTDGPTETDQHSEVEAALQKAPGETDVFMFMNLGAMRADSKTRTMFEYEDLIESVLFSPISSHINNVDHLMAIGLLNHDTAMSATGNIDSGDMIGALTQMGFERGEYRGIEIWQGQLSQQNEYGDPVWDVAFLPQEVVYGSTEGVRAIIDVITGSAPSLNRSDDHLDVLNRLPSGIAITLTRSDFWPSGKVYTGQRLVGMGLLQTQPTIRGTVAIWKFDTQANAKAVMTEIEDDIREEGGWEYEYTIHVSQDGQYVTAVVNENLSRPLDEP